MPSSTFSSSKVLIRFKKGILWKRRSIYLRRLHNKREKKSHLNAPASTRLISFSRKTDLHSRIAAWQNTPNYQEHNGFQFCQRLLRPSCVRPAIKEVTFFVPARKHLENSNCVCAQATSLTGSRPPGGGVDNNCSHSIYCPLGSRRRTRK